MFDGYLFTTKHANVTSQEHNDTRDDTLVEVGTSLCFSLILLRFISVYSINNNDNDNEDDNNDDDDNYDDYDDNDCDNDNDNDNDDDDDDDDCDDDNDNNSLYCKKYISFVTFSPKN